MSFRIAPTLLTFSDERRTRAASQFTIGVPLGVALMHDSTSISGGRGQDLRHSRLLRPQDKEGASCQLGPILQVPLASTFFSNAAIATDESSAFSAGMHDNVAQSGMTLFVQVNTSAMVRKTGTERLRFLSLRSALRDEVGIVAV